MTRNSDKQAEQIKLQPGAHVHLVGIGGSGLSAIARVLVGRGFIVSGSDVQENDLTAELASAGVKIYQGHQAEHCSGAEILLMSSAISPDNPEVVAARAAGVPVFKRAEFLGAMMSESIGIAIAGTHGKTTTTGMVTEILMKADLDPTVIVGGVLPLLGSNGRAGQSNLFVVEADEYDNMFLGLKPQMTVITNVEYDHPDLFPTADEYFEAFRRFVQLLPSDGQLIVCGDDPKAARLGTNSHAAANVTTYGLEEADWRATDLRLNQLGGTDFLVQNRGRMAGLARLRVPGQHNVRNALAAIVLADTLGVEFDQIRQALATFGGVGRRFQVMGEVGDVTVVDDYAHHPTEIQATLSAARERFPGRRIWAVWQPHTYSRTKRLLNDFAASFDDADRVVVLDIFRSRESDSMGIDVSVVLQAMDHLDVDHAGGIEDTAAFVLDRVKPGDVIVMLTAGDGNLVGKAILKGVREYLANGSPAGSGNHSSSAIVRGNRL